ncbi:MAG: dynamin family protein [Granulosicoccus sp.]|nr:dynamin family protein [Granulosicoccus sp.]
MVRPDKSIVKRFASLKMHLERENPVLIDAIGGFRKLDSIGYKTGLIATDDSYAMQISWWPLISILGVFSAGKSSFINSYLGQKLQKTGNQAVDDKFTVICYGEENAGRVLPGLALDADMRFPFYRISDEIEKVTEGEGRRIDAYLQLKVTDSEVVRGKILIDSPGFDADAQRTSTLKLTNHIMDISDLVLVFFDARHPEPGAMQDTLTHLVENTIARNDSSKFLFILNQIDTAAREDNTEEIVGAWQRALSQKGLTAGRFYTIYNKEVALSIENEGLRRRFEEKRDADMAEIEERIRQVEVERAYRIVGAMEREAYTIRDRAIPAIARLKATWSRRVLRFDALLLALVVVIVLAGAAMSSSIGALMGFILSLFADPVSMFSVILGLVLISLVVHFLIRNLVAQFMASRLRKTDDEQFARAFRFNTRFYRSVFSKHPVGWSSRSRKTIDEVIEQASDFVESLNDQFTNPSGKVRSQDTAPG